MTIRVSGVSCFAVYVLANNTRVVSYFYRWPYTTQNMVQPVYYSPVHTQQAENHVLFSKQESGSVTCVMTYRARITTGDP